MGRRKKIEENPVQEESSHSKYAEIGETVICPICGKEFKRTPEHAYIASGNYTCSWQCFLKKIKEEKLTNGNDKVADTNVK